MRRFDKRLTDDDIAEIARIVDENATARRALNPKKRRLENGVAPLDVVRVRT
jgi:hypothetical protein